MRFSVIIPLYNKENYIKETLDSVMKQSFSDFEVLVIDDSSIDNSVNIVRQYNDKRIKIFTKQNSGVSDTRNYGIQFSSGDFICFLDADDIWKENYLAELNKAIEAFPNISFFCSGFNYFQDSVDNILQHNNQKKYNCKKLFCSDFIKMSYLNHRSVALTSAVCIRRDLLLQNNIQFCKGISMGEDVDVWVRVALLSDLVFINEELMLYRYEGPYSLTCTTNCLSREFDYSQWYELNSENKYLRKFTTWMLLHVARKSRLVNPLDGMNILKKIRGHDFFLLRIAVYLVLLFQSKLKK